MVLLIDGYNLLHATDIFGDAGPGTDLHRTRLALLNFLAAAITERDRKHTTIVFDAAGAPPGLPKTITHMAMTVHFAPRHSDADEMIEDLLEECRTPRALTVVSGDHRVQRAARGRGASYVDSAQWYADRKAALRKSAGELRTAKPETHMSSAEVAYWLGKFGGDDAPSDSTSPFPAGFGDDLPED